MPSVQKEYHVLNGRIVWSRSAKQALAYVRFGSKADISAYPRHIRFTPERGHRPTIGREGNLKGQIVERAAKLLALLNDLMANYQMLRRRISSLAE
jgi:hypothetical protein